MTSVVPLVAAAGIGAVADHMAEGGDNVIHEAAEDLGLIPHSPDEKELLFLIARLLDTHLTMHPKSERDTGEDVEFSLQLTSIPQHISSSERQYTYIYTPLQTIINYLVPGIGTMVLNLMPGWNMLPLRNMADVSLSVNNVTTTQNVRVRVTDAMLNFQQIQPLTAYDANGNIQELNIGGNTFTDNDGVIRAHALSQIAKTMRNGPMTQNGLAAATTSNQLNVGTPAPFMLLVTSSVAGTITIYLNASNGGTLGQLLKPDGSGPLSITATAGVTYAIQCPPAQNAAIQVSAGPTNITLQAIGFVGG